MIEFIAREAGLECKAEWDVLNQSEVTGEEPISLQLANVPVKSVIKLMLQQVNTGDQFNPLDTFLDGGVLVFSTRQNLYSRTKEIGIYDVSDFVVNRSVPYAPFDRLSMLMDTITRHVGRPTDWECFGGTVTSIRIFRNKLIVRLSLDDHVRIQKILAAFRKAPGGRPVSLEDGE